METQSDIGPDEAIAAEVMPILIASGFAVVAVILFPAQQVHLHDVHYDLLRQERPRQRSHCNAEFANNPASMNSA